MDQICTQTFGLKKAFSQDLIGTIEKLHALGFDGIEPFVMFNAQQGKLPKNLWALDTLKAAKEKMDELGMTIPSAHMGVAFGWFSVPVKTVVSNIRMLHENYGIRDFVMSTTFGSVAQAKHWARVCKKIADGIRPYGCRVLYHNHDDEFHKVTYKGKTVDAMEVFLEQTGDDVLLQLDIGWAGIAGDEQAIVKKYANRIAALHLKDFYPDYRSGKYTRKNMPVEAFSPIGEGTIATGQILAIRQQLPDFTGSIIIDQDKSAGDMLKDVETGIGNVRTML
jgi:sugar phosphate isomerase/epimerase